MNIKFTVFPKNGYEAVATVKFDINNNDYARFVINHLEQLVKSDYEIYPGDDWLKLYIDCNEPANVLDFIKKFAALSSKKRKLMKESAEYYIYKHNKQSITTVLTYNDCDSETIEKIKKHFENINATI